ncbi:hypothetical protein ACM614_02595 [Streptomyces sp. 12297]|uniref:hypothetical protein n=1 Tax=Streptomyces sp. NBC_00239 TaxID=2903640 RepID=UPI002E2AB851|nr:hypothetical protein [Streptomyces sp. NBC_00239]
MWRSEEFGSSHDGRAAAVLADGSEPGPRYFDQGSGTNFHKTSDWWVYDGTHGAPLATDLRAACACGWRGSARYPLDWTLIADDDPEDYDTSGPETEWERHLDEVEARSVPLPAGFQELLDSVKRQLDSLAVDAPLAALKAVAAMERHAKRVARQAAYAVEADEVPWARVGTALGLTEEGARSRLTHYAIRH